MKDHAQGLSCPDSALWLKYGPQGLLDKINGKQETTEFYTCTKLVLEGAITFMKRYHDYIISMPDYHKSDDLKRVADNCSFISKTSKNIP